ncbi:conjugal transfer protein [Streptomyces viridosporus]
MSTRTLTKGQAWVLGAAAAAMVAVGVAGGWGTYSNAVSEFHRQATAAGVVAAGEGLTLILAMVMLGRTMLGMSSPAVVRAGMWLAPVSASCIGITIAGTVREAAVYAVTPLAMSGAAEGLGFIARSVVVYRTGVDAEVQRRNADTARQLAFYRAVATGHPDARKRKRAVRRYWSLAKHVGVGDTELGAGLVDVQRHRVQEGADAALADMYGAPAPELPEVTLERLDDDQVPTVEAPRPRPEVVPADARLLPIVARPEPVTEEPVRLYGVDHFAQQYRPVDELPELVTSVSTPVGPWADKFPNQASTGMPPAMTNAVPAEKPRQVVTATVTLTPSDLRRQARRLNREAVRSTNRPVTIKTLQDELGLSRREATDLRREVVGGERS